MKIEKEVIRQIRMICLLFLKKISMKTIFKIINLWIVHLILNRLCNNRILGLLKVVKEFILEKCNKVLDMDKDCMLLENKYLKESLKIMSNFKDLKEISMEYILGNLWMDKDLD